MRHACCRCEMVAATRGLLSACAPLSRACWKLKVTTYTQQLVHIMQNFRYVNINYVWSHYGTAGPMHTRAMGHLNQGATCRSFTGQQAGCKNQQAASNWLPGIGSLELSLRQEPSWLVQQGSHHSVCAGALSSLPSGPGSRPRSGLRCPLRCAHPRVSPAAWSRQSPQRLS